MGWLNFDAPEHEGYLVAPVDDGRGRTRELGLDDPDQPIAVVQVGCDCGWRSQRIHAPFSTRFAPSTVLTTDDFEERARGIWHAHLDPFIERACLPDDEGTRVMFAFVDPPRQLYRAAGPSVPWDAQAMVREFHVAMDQLVRDEPSLHQYPKQLRVDLIQEELDEFAEAAVMNDLVKMVDALADLLYVVYGSAVSLGVEIGPVFQEVHAANMAKVGGPVREDGKRLKPPGWRPPDVAGVIARLYGRDAIENAIVGIEDETDLDRLVAMLRALSTRLDDARAVNDEHGTLAIHKALIETKRALADAITCARSLQAVRKGEAIETRPHDEIALGGEG
jgi:predicted HAD superfamily Cof-like phosphohydrolase